MKSLIMLVLLENRDSSKEAFEISIIELQNFWLFLACESAVCLLVSRV